MRNDEMTRHDTQTDGHSLLYRVFPAKRTQERGCYELILGLLRSQMTSMGSQDQAQITFRYEKL